MICCFLCYTGLQGRLNLEGNVKATKWKLTWLPDIVDLVPLQLWDFGPLITKKKPEEDDDIADLVNPQSVRCKGHNCCWLVARKPVSTVCKRGLMQGVCSRQCLVALPRTHGHISAC